MEESAVLDAFRVRSVFPHLADHAAFIDKLVVAVWGRRRVRLPTTLTLDRSRPIAAPNGTYARSMKGKCVASGNPFELKYGRLLPYPNVPPFHLTLRSDRTPLSGAQVLMVANGLFNAGLSVQVASLELTFDVSTYKFADFRKSIYTRARLIRDFAGVEFNSFYVGGPRSRWQLRIYEKTRAIVRVEYVLRRAFLSDNHVNRIDDLVLLRDVNLWALASFKEFRNDRLIEKLAGFPPSWSKDLLLEAPRRWPLPQLVAVLRGRHRINPGPIMRRSQAQVLLQYMHDNLIW